jgi:DNA invertase Pin-like site-specific DNA recombinase
MARAAKAQAKPIDVYIRVSRVGSRDRDKLRSPGDQQHDAEAFARSRGLELSGVVHEDIDASGGNLDRPGLQAALRRVREGESGGIVAAYLSRASRDTRSGLELLEDITKAGGSVFAPNLPDDYLSADGKMLTTIQLAIDTGYRDRKSEEFERAKIGAVENGIHLGNRPPAGLKWRSEKDHHLVHTEDAPAVREAFEARAAGAGPTAVGKLLESHGVKTSMGSATWSKQAVSGLLRNRVYLGEVAYGDVVNAEAHEPVVDLVTFEAAQSPRPVPMPSRSKADNKNGSPYSASGIVRCMACGYALQGTRTSHGHRIYRCIRRHAGGVCPAPVRVSAKLVEAGAESVFFATLNDLRARGTVAGPDLTALQEDFDRADAAWRRAKGPAGMRALGDEWEATVTEFREERDAAAKVLGRARAEAEKTTPVPDVVGVRDAWPDLKPTEKRELFATQFDALGLRREPSGGVSLVVFRHGTLEGHLSRRGYRREPTLRPLRVPDDARVASLHDLQEGAGERAI